MTGRELWNGNREKWRTWASPTHPIRWAWATYDGKQVTYPERFASERLRPRPRAPAARAVEKRGRFLARVI